MLTLQQVFDRAARHLILQNARSVWNPNTTEQSCAYRGPGELMCAVGALIDDAHYRPQMENLRASSSCIVSALSASGMPVDAVAVDLYGRLQGVHDTSQPAVWVSRLYSVAAEYELDDTIIQTSIHERDLRIQEAANAL